MAGIDAIRERVIEKHIFVNSIRSEIAKVVVGQRDLIDGLILGLFTKGHILIEGVPGLAKTSAVKALASTVNANFKRIQFTPDLLPADLIGTEVFLPKTGDFTIKKGPIFHNIILADEINRAPSKVQSALLEAMQERQVTIGGTTFMLGDPFLVLATQNPIEQEGTYPLPEAQVDRFMLKLIVNYPDKNEEKEIVKRVGFENPYDIKPVIDTNQLNEIVQLIRDIYVDEKLMDYMVNIVSATRNPKSFNIDISDYIHFGASPRASIYLSLVSRAYAFLQGKPYVSPQDIKIVAPNILRHRIILTYEAEAENVTSDEIISRIFDSIEVP
ncbi:MAG: MoxR family ATPase [Desulfobacterales bacterium]|nr:MoxR family ATPase [Desulfobacterales bacterium]MBF0397633.1 MoxR family ATPase [Desulfobacterales bacterium]